MDVIFFADSYVGTFIYLFYLLFHIYIPPFSKFTYVQRWFTKKVLNNNIIAVTK